MVKKENKLIGIVADKEDQIMLDYLTAKLKLKPTQLYRQALRAYYCSERNKK